LQRREDIVEALSVLEIERKLSAYKGRNSPDKPKVVHLNVEGKPKCKGGGWYEKPMTVVLKEVTCEICNGKRYSGRLKHTKNGPNKADKRRL
jgi:excinuclease UvrABC ATPase subunit